jgi:hypothetical protein
MADARLIAAALMAAAVLPACTSPCGLKMQQLVFLAPPIMVNDKLVQQDTPLACCGGSAFRDVDLSNIGEFEIDVTNPNGNGVDGFITNVGCDRLFNAPYTGAANAPLCPIHVGPVRPRTVSERKKVPPGRYRIFAQGYASNDTSQSIALDVGLWSNACKWNPIDP